MIDHGVANAKKVIATALALLGATVAAFLMLGKTFMPTMDEGDILMQVAKLPSIALEQSARTDLAVQKSLME
ncbi:MAG TPA: efflux RND transporter permease subunit, partial [Accumulibacter sp.]|uniref:efflux RND transporter permease subunit n=1 Tax=Accumulibacter sp. TaxID=2053492 RepID=UPI002C817124